MVVDRRNLRLSILFSKHPDTVSASGLHRSQGLVKQLTLIYLEGSSTCALPTSYPITPGFKESAKEVALTDSVAKY